MGGSQAIGITDLVGFLLALGYLRRMHRRGDHKWYLGVMLAMGLGMLVIGVFLVVT